MKLASLFLVLPVLFWGLSFVAIKVVLRELDPVEMISMRFLIAAPILYAITRFKRLSIWPKGNWRLLGSGVGSNNGSAVTYGQWRMVEP